MLKWGSVFAFLLMVLGLTSLLARQEVIARSVPGVAIQIAAALLMIAARITFGRRSFHAAANPTEGGLVTTGPYRWLRHPIYAAILYFVWTTAIDHHTWQAIAAAVVVTIGGALRMLAEEKLLIAKYPAYASYRQQTARVIPFVL
jgi:protein-S-isoprenylcysteine O-methyltransferase Ste14